MNHLNMEDIEIFDNSIYEENNNKNNKKYNKKYEELKNEYSVIIGCIIAGILGFYTFTRKVNVPKPNPNQIVIDFSKLGYPSSTLGFKLIKLTVIVILIYTLINLIRLTIKKIKKDIK